MSTDLLLPLYFGLVPAILVVAGVQAVRRRQVIGSRASTRLIAGAGVS